MIDMIRYECGWWSGYTWAEGLKLGIGPVDMQTQFFCDCSVVMLRTLSIAILKKSYMNKTLTDIWRDGE